MRHRARWWLGTCSLVGWVGLVGPACSEPDPPPAEVAASGTDASPPEPTTATTATPADGETVVEDEVPLEPLVRLVSAGKGKEHTLPPRTPGTERRMVVEVRITEGTKKVLHLPATRLTGDVVLDGIDDTGSRWRWTPRTSTVLVSGDGVDPEFLVKFEAALAPGDAPAALPMVTDRWDAVTDLRWPTGDDPHAGRIGAALRLALGHLAIPVPTFTMNEGTRWEVRRRVDILGIPAWQTLACTAKTIEGPQLEVNATVSYVLAADEPITGTPLGLADVVGLSGKGKLRARYDLPSATTVDLELTGTLEVRTAAEAKPKRFGFELHVDEDYMAKPDPRVTLKGELTQGGLVIGVVPAGTKVWFDKEPVMVSPEGDFLFGFGRDAEPRALLSFAFAGGATERHVVHVADREFEPEVIDGLPPEMVELDRETRVALAKSRTKVTRVRKRASEVAYYRDGFRWPVKGKITSTYGRKRVLNDEDHDYHWGVDVAVPVGKKIKAPAAGVVVLAEMDVPLSGNLLILDHGHGLTSSFLHLQKFKVKEGDVVKAGQVIATSGNSGRSTGPHLDWRMNLFDTRIDPQTVVGAKP
jgi:murein DD-endopeptidase MepM/ murein hydrolase activator NlpD